MAANISIIDLTEDSFTEEFVSTGDDIHFEPPSNQSLIFVGETSRPESRPIGETPKKLSGVEPSASAAPPIVDQPKCPICMETFSEIKVSQRALMSTQCGQIFCSRCLEMVKKPYRSKTSTGQKFVVQCPTCRKTWHWTSCHPIYL